MQTNRMYLNCLRFHCFVSPLFSLLLHSAPFHLDLTCGLIAAVAPVLRFATRVAAEID